MFGFVRISWKNKKRKNFHLWAVLMILDGLIVSSKKSLLKPTTTTTTATSSKANDERLNSGNYESVTAQSERFIFGALIIWRITKFFMKFFVLHQLSRSLAPAAFMNMPQQINYLWGTLFRGAKSAFILINLQRAEIPNLLAKVSVVYLRESPLYRSRCHKQCDS